jgi:hypothetical protein
MIKQLQIDWPILPGSISTAKSLCGKEGCACKKKRAPDLHPVYYRWTGFIAGKRTTKTVSKEVAMECKRRINNYRTLRKELKSCFVKALLHGQSPDYHVVARDVGN